MTKLSGTPDEPSESWTRESTSLPMNTHGSGGLRRATATANDSSLITCATSASHPRGNVRNDGASVAAIR